MNFPVDSLLGGGGVEENEVGVKGWVLEFSAVWEENEKESVSS